MALFKFTKAIINDEAIDVYNHGKMLRDFTYVNVIVEAASRLVNKPLLLILNGQALFQIQVHLVRLIKFITLETTVQYA